MQIPVAVLALNVTKRFIREDLPATPSRHLDLPGATTWTCGLAALLFGLNRGNAWGWTSPAVWLPLLLSATLLIAFLRIERRNPKAMVDLTLFVRSSFSLSVATLVLSFVSGYLVTVLLPFYLIQSRRLGPATAGLVLGAFALIRVVAAPLSGRLSDRIGSALPATLGAATLALGSILLALLSPDSSLESLVVGVLVAGAGIGIFVPANNSMLMGAVPKSRNGIASGILATSRTIGMAIGVALAGVIGTSGAGFELASAIALLTSMLCASMLSGKEGLIANDVRAQ
jgi:predicted MFS family arabinose efflux permease